jgi:putative adhesin
MNVKVLLVGLILSVTPAAVFAMGDTASQVSEQKAAAEPAVAVSLCVLAGNVTVQGWDRNEVTVKSNEGAQIELRRNVAGNQPASKIQVVVTDKDDTLRTRSGCQASTDLELHVPKGATVQVQTREGSINIAGVAVAYAGTQNGDINVARVSRVIEVGTVAGCVSVSDSSGRMDLNSIAGSVSVTNVRPVNADDLLEVTSVSGELEIERATHAQVNMRTVNGSMRLTGPLANGGRYGINTMSGDVTLALPADASFQLHAKISSHADIISDFPVTLVSDPVSMIKPSTAAAPTAPERSTEPVQPTPQAPRTPQQPISVSGEKKTPRPSPEPIENPMVITVNPDIRIKPDTKVKIKPDKIAVAVHTLRRLTAVCGSGDAIISLASFSGTLHLQKD